MGQLNVLLVSYAHNFFVTSNIAIKCFFSKIWVGIKKVSFFRGGGLFTYLSPTGALFGWQKTGGTAAAGSVIRWRNKWWLGDAAWGLGPLYIVMRDPLFPRGLILFLSLFLFWSPWWCSGSPLAGAKGPFVDVVWLLLWLRASWWNDWNSWWCQIPGHVDWFVDTLSVVNSQ